MATQGSDNIVVEIPGQNRKDLVDTVKQTAQLRFRLVAARRRRPAAAVLLRAVPGRRQRLRERVGQRTRPRAASPSSGASVAPEGVRLAPRPRAGALRRPGRADGTASSPKADASPKARRDREPAGSAAASPRHRCRRRRRSRHHAKGAPVDQPLQWMDNPGRQVAARSSPSYTCPAGRQGGGPGRRRQGQPLVDLRRGRQQVPALRRDDRGHPAHRRPRRASRSNQVQWVVNLTFDSDRAQDLRQRHPDDRQRDQPADRPAEAVRDRARRQGDLRADGQRRDPQRPGRDQRQLHPGPRRSRSPTA